MEVAPTTDHGRVGAALDDRTFRSNTSLTHGVLAALNSAQAAAGDQRQPTSIVLSDGAVDSRPPLEQAISAARQASVPITTVALGTPRGTILLNEGELRVPLQAEDLSRLARSAGGESFDARSPGDLRAVYQNLEQALNPPLVLDSLATWFFVGALILVVAASAWSLLWFAQLP